MRKDVERCMRNAHVLKTMLVGAGIKTMLNEVGAVRGSWCWQHHSSTPGALSGGEFRIQILVV